MTTEDTSQMPLFSPEDEKEAQKELDRLPKNENGPYKVNHKRTGFEHKTLWDWLQLVGVLAIPLILGIATLLFGIQQANLANQQHDNDQKIANQQHEVDKQSALDQQQAAILQTYIDNIQELLLHDNLSRSNAGDEVAILARARTLTALQGLDPERKGRLLIFLYEAQLIGFVDAKNNLHSPIIDLNEANLSGAYLSEASLSGAYLSGANLHSANLNGAHLYDAQLSSADLSSADLIKVNLNNANLSNADLSRANLNGAQLGFARLNFADLNFAHLSGAELDRAQLDFARLIGADLNRTNLIEASLYYVYLSDAENLTQQQLDQVSSCKGAILPTGLTCHHNQ